MCYNYTVVMTKESLDTVFRAYDIRGKTPGELDEDFFYNLGKAYTTRFKPASVVVGHDIRPQSFTFKQSLIKGLLESGCDVIDVGEIATEMLYYIVGAHPSVYDGGLVVTASHNPIGWSGCKLVSKQSKPIGKDTGLLDLKEIMLNQDYRKVSDNFGDLTDIYIYKPFKDKVRSFIQTEKRRPLKVVVDAGNGIGGRVFDYLFGDLGLDVKQMYFVPNGFFPNHVPDPMKEENVTDLKQRVLEENADLGIAIDGDADRVFFIDKKGRRPDGVYMGVLLAKYLLKNNENKKIIHDPRITWPFQKEAKKLGAETFQSTAGHSYFKQKMFEKQALFGAEASSHFYYKDFYNCDSGMITIALMLQMYFEGFDLTKSMDSLFDKYPNSGEVNYRVEDPNKLLEEIKNHYQNLGAKIDRIDGVSVEFEDWRCNLRKSNTQPLVRLNLEADSRQTVVSRFKEVEALIGSERDNSPSLPELI